MSRTLDPFDELAAMFLTAPAAIAPQSSFPGGNEDASLQAAAPPKTRSSHAPGQASTMENPRNAAPITELLVTGHLPVRGGLWLTPYADALARQHGAAALVRIDGDEPSLQLLRPLDQATAFPGDQSLEQSIHELGAVADVWVIRPPAATPHNDLLAVTADRITLLSSADEAAVVAAYQSVKDLAQAAEQSGGRLPAIGLAIVGTDARTAAAVVERLNRTTVSFLGVEIKLVMCLPRMDAGVKSTRYLVFRSDNSCSLADVTRWIGSAKAKRVAARRDEPREVAGQLYADRLDAHVVDARSILASEPAIERPAHARTSLHSTTTMPLPQRALPAQPPHDSTAAAASAPHAPHIKLAPKPSIDIEPKQPSRAAEPDDHGKPVPLATHVEGLTLLPLRAPGHERIELAIDRAGRLHLLGRESTLREMTIVEAWAKAHRELIAMACPSHPIDPSAKTVGHVFTDQPATLADLHGTGLRLHVLAPVVVNGRTGWYAAALNTGAP
jgi:hypothetical protein